MKLSLRSLRRVLPAAGLTALLALAACGGGGESSSKVASLGTAAAEDDGATNDTLSPEDSQEALLAYAACMRENGVDMADPTFDADGNAQLVQVFGPDSDINPNSDEFGAAQDACGSLIENVDLGGRGNNRVGVDPEQIQAAMNEFTSCLRDEGLTVDDITLPGPGSGPQVIGPGPDAGEGGEVTGDGPPTSSFDARPPGDGGPTFQSGGPGAEGFDPTTMLIEQLGLDDTDPAVIAALEVCQPLVDDAFTPTTDA